MPKSLGGNIAANEDRGCPHHHRHGDDDGHQNNHAPPDRCVTPGIVVVFVVFPHRKLPHHAAGAGLLFYQVTRHQKQGQELRSQPRAASEQNIHNG
jgi:hypothetical protein